MDVKALGPMTVVSSRDGEAQTFEVRDHPETAPVTSIDDQSVEDSTSEKKKSEQQASVLIDLIKKAEERARKRRSQKVNYKMTMAIATYERVSGGVDQELLKGDILTVIA